MILTRLGDHQSSPQMAENFETGFDAFGELPICPLTTNSASPKLYFCGVYDTGV
jgi:hypothetical protein